VILDYSAEFRASEDFLGVAAALAVRLPFDALWRAAERGAALLAGEMQPASAAEMAIGAKSGLPVPRFVSLKPDRVNVRGGPTREHEVAWVYTRSGLPVEITAEFGTRQPPQTHAWFVGFRSDLAFAVLVEGGGFGGEVAAPLAARFLQSL